jgi:poly-beta-1,6-N-acetyl-D-glucosamine biosynthesis protein PgaD
MSPIHKLSPRHDWDSTPGQRPFLGLARVFPLMHARSESLILDDSRNPMRTAPAAGRREIALAWLMFIWLHYVRPLVVFAFWAALLGYAWREMGSSPSDPELMGILPVIAGVLVAIICCMVLATPIHVRETAAEEANSHHVQSSTFPQMASYADMPPQRLAVLQACRNIVAYHDPDGRVVDAYPSEEEWRQAS